MSPQDLLTHLDQGRLWGAPPSADPAFDLQMDPRQWGPLKDELTALFLTKICQDELNDR